LSIGGDRFGLLELADCEEHRPSARGDAWTSLQPHLGSREGRAMEGVYLEAIAASRLHYGDRQVYVYCYPGHYHKDEGNEDRCEVHLWLAVIVALEREPAHLLGTLL
jgi:hypothetical protein